MAPRADRHAPSLHSALCTVVQLPCDSTGCCERRLRMVCGRDWCSAQPHGSGVLDLLVGGRCIPIASTKQSQGFMHGTFCHDERRQDHGSGVALRGREHIVDSERGTRSHARSGGKMIWAWPLGQFSGLGTRICLALPAVRNPLELGRRQANVRPGRGDDRCLRGLPHGLGTGCGVEAVGIDSPGLARTNGRGFWRPIDCLLRTLGHVSAPKLGRQRAAEPPMCGVQVDTPGERHGRIRSHERLVRCTETSLRLMGARKSWTPSLRLGCTRESQPTWTMTVLAAMAH